MIRRRFPIFPMNCEKMHRITLFLNANITRVPKKFRPPHVYPCISAAYALAQRNQQKKTRAVREILPKQHASDSLVLIRLPQPRLHRRRTPAAPAIRCTPHPSPVGASQTAPSASGSPPHGTRGRHTAPPPRFRMLSSEVSHIAADPQAVFPEKCRQSAQRMLFSHAAPLQSLSAAFRPPAETFRTCAADTADVYQSAPCSFLLLLLKSS